jgi:molecular chaperone DnaK
MPTKRRLRRGAEFMYLIFDLGTRLCLFAGRFHDGIVRVLNNPDGAPATPTAIAFVDGDPDKVIFGAAARAYRAVHPEYVAVMTKRARGERDVLLLIDKNDKGWTAIELEVLLVRWLAEHAEATTGKKIAGIFATIPVDAVQRAREGVIEVIESAGYKAVGLLTESTAAAFHILQQIKDVTKIMTVDIGGGTTDVTIMEATPDAYKVLASAGRNDLAGHELTLVLVNRCSQEVEKRGIPFAPEDNPRDFVLLEAACEDAKITLSTQPSAFITWRVGAELFDLEITVEEFNTLAAPIRQGVRELMVEALTAAGLSPEQLDIVVPVGGSTRVPCLLQEIEDVAGKDRVKVVADRDQAVVLGAAESLGSRLKEIIDSGNGDIEPDEVPDYVLKSDKVLDVTSHTVGILAEDRSGDASLQDEVLVPFVEKNTPLPAQCTKAFTVDINPANQAGDVPIRLAEGEPGCSAEQANILATYTFEGVPRGQGKPIIDVTLSFDSSRLLSLDVKDRKSGRELHESYDGSDALSPDPLLPGLN